MIDGQWMRLDWNHFDNPLEWLFIVQKQSWICKRHNQKISTSSKAISTSIILFVIHKLCFSSFPTLSQAIANHGKRLSLSVQFRCFKIVCSYIQSDIIPQVWWYSWHPYMARHHNFVQTTLKSCCQLHKSIKKYHLLIDQKPKK
jgi:hypothetical protein